MLIEFLCRTTSPELYINSAHFQFPDGHEIVIDREMSEWSYDPEKEEIHMIWRNLYRWEDEHYNEPVPYRLLKDAASVLFEIEDDAPEGYDITCVNFWLLRIKEEQN